MGTCVGDGVTSASGDAGCPVAVALGGVTDAGGPAVDVTAGVADVAEGLGGAVGATGFVSTGPTGEIVGATGTAVSSTVGDGTLSVETTVTVTCSVGNGATGTVAITAEPVGLAAGGTTVFVGSVGELTAVVTTGCGMGVCVLSWMPGWSVLRELFRADAIVATKSTVKTITSTR